VQPDRASVVAFLARVHRRLVLKTAIQGATAGSALAIILAIAGWPSRGATALTLAFFGAAVIAGVIAGLALTANRRRRVADVVERRAPASRNLIVTASELFGTETSGYVPELVLSRAARFVDQLDPAALVPTRRSAVAAGALFATWLLVVSRALLPASVSLRGEPADSPTSPPALHGIDVTVTPPAYAGRAVTTIHDPSRITALAGSTLSVAVRANGERVTVETLSSLDSLTKQGSAFTRQIVATTDGFIAIQARRGDRVSERRLIGLTVLPDSLPHVRVATPGRDQRFPDARREIAVAIEASDDIGLASLAMRYTKVSGSGERFTFVDGEIPLTITRRDDHAWIARGVLPLDSLELGPGDMVVYRAIAADHRSSGGTAESDSYIAEITAPGGVAAPGFAADFEQERYAVSQQMVIVKTERLIARRASMPPADFADESQQLAAEQRKVRAEFVFMLGGELADAPDVAASMTDINEEEEAGRESDILAGHEANAGHVALIRGIRAMSRAAASLGTADPTTALPHERAALTQLERAFSHSRILLRALATRERLDPSRRLTGSLADATGNVRPLAEPTRDVASVTLRRVLSDASALAGKRDHGSSDAARASTLAEQALRVDPSSPALQDVSAQLSAAAAAMSAHRPDETTVALDRATNAIVRLLRRGLPDAPSVTSDLGERRMHGALVDALRTSRP